MPHRGCGEPRAQLEGDQGSGPACSKLLPPGLLKGQAAYGKQRLEHRACVGAVPTQTQISQAGVGMGAQVARGSILALPQALRIPWVACSSHPFLRRAGLESSGLGAQGRGGGGGNLDSKHNPHVPIKFKAPGSARGTSARQRPWVRV